VLRQIRKITHNSVFFRFSFSVLLCARLATHFEVSSFVCSPLTLCTVSYKIERQYYPKASLFFSFLFAGFYYITRPRIPFFINLPARMAFPSGGGPTLTPPSSPSTNVHAHTNNHNHNLPHEILAETQLASSLVTTIISPSHATSTSTAAAPIFDTNTNKNKNDNSSLMMHASLSSRTMTLCASGTPVLPFQRSPSPIAITKPHHGPPDAPNPYPEERVKSNGSSSPSLLRSASVSDSAAAAGPASKTRKDPGRENSMDASPSPPPSPSVSSPLAALASCRLAHDDSEEEGPLCSRSASVSVSVESSCETRSDDSLSAGGHTFCKFPFLSFLISFISFCPSSFLPFFILPHLFF
jgi:hypothetical protein